MQIPDVKSKRIVGVPGFRQRLLISCPIAVAFTAWWSARTGKIMTPTPLQRLRLIT